MVQLVCETLLSVSRSSYPGVSGTTIGLVIGIVLLIFIIACVVVLFIRKKKEWKNEGNRSKTMKTEVNEDYGTYSRCADSVTEVSTSISRDPTLVLIQTLSRPETKTLIMAQCTRVRKCQRPRMSTKTTMMTMIPCIPIDASLRITQKELAHFHFAKTPQL